LKITFIEEIVENGCALEVAPKEEDTVR